MLKIKVKKINKEATLPEYAHPGDAGLDICSIEDCEIKPGERYSFNTGLAFEIPDKYVGLVWDKGGPAFKYGLHCLAGVLDSGYRGELVVVMLNTGNKSHHVKKGDKIAQLLIQKVERADIKVVDSLSDTERGQGKFGSTGR